LCPAAARNGKLHDVHALDLLLPEAGAINVMDRGYVGMMRLPTRGDQRRDLRRSAGRHILRALK
jgi:hypothetical protein